MDLLDLGFAEEGRDLPSVLPASTNVRQSQSQAPVHRWYVSVFSFPPELVNYYIEEFSLDADQVLADPFCGTGTTLVEAKKRGIACVGVDSFPFAHFVTSTKCRWDIDPDRLLAVAESIVGVVEARLASDGIYDSKAYEGDVADLQLLNLDKEEYGLLIKNSISELPLHKTLVLRSEIDRHEGEPFYPHLRLALAKALVASIGNLRFGPEVGTTKPKKDTEVISPWLENIMEMATDIIGQSSSPSTSSGAILADARSINQALPAQSVDAVITSPPYPNEKEYTRAARLESVILGYLTSKRQLRLQKKDLLRSNTRAVYKGDDDDSWITDYPEIVQLARKIESRRKSVGGASGFERLYERVIRLYFGGMARHLESLQDVLRHGASLAYVVGDQASFYRITVQTAKLLAIIAESLGYELIRIDHHRNRFSTSTRKKIAEEVLILRWP